MAKVWKCARCSAANDEGAITCSTCGLIRGGVVVAGSYTPPPTSVPPPAMEAGTGIAPVETPSGLDWRPAPAAPTPLWRRIPLRLVIVAVIIGGGAIVGRYANAGRSSTGEITKGGDLTSNELRVGDCWDLKDPAAETIGDVTARPCTEAHEYEVFYAASMPGGAYLAEDAFGSYVQNNCEPAFATYVGKNYQDSELDIFWLYPTDDGWTSGDRTVECSAYHPRIHCLTASVKGSNQ